MGLIDPGLQVNESIMELAKEVLDPVYECEPRSIECSNTTTKYGYSFPINPEILAHIMKLSRGKKVLEIAGARGENSLFMGLAGAQEVYLNDMELGELAVFKTIIQCLPKKLQQKFHIIPGDCLKVFEDDCYTEQFDVIYARNIFHFFMGEKRKHFIHVVSRLLKPGGLLVLTVNSAIHQLGKEKMLQHPEAYAFLKRTPMFRLIDKNISISGFGEKSVAADLSLVDPLEYHFAPTVKFTSEEIVYLNEFKHLSPNYQIYLSPL